MATTAKTTVLSWLLVGIVKPPVDDVYNNPGSDTRRDCHPEIFVFEQIHAFQVSKKRPLKQRLSGPDT
jgi:hypothetical protein